MSVMEEATAGNTACPAKCKLYIAGENVLIRMWKSKKRRRVVAITGASVAPSSGKSHRSLPLNGSLRSLVRIRIRGEYPEDDSSSAAGPRFTLS
jgi:hypothetical protein